MEKKRIQILLRAIENCIFDSWTEFPLVVLQIKWL